MYLYIFYIKCIYKYFTFLRFVAKYFPNVDTERNQLNIIIDLALYSLFLTCLSFLGLWNLWCWYDPTGGVFLAALVPSRYFSSACGAFLLLLQSYVRSLQIFSTAYMGLSVFAYMYYLTFLLTRELHIHMRHKYLSSPNLREPRHIQLVFRSLQLCNTRAMRALGFLILFDQIAYSLTPMYINFVLIRYWEQLETNPKMLLVIASPCILTFWTIVLQLGGYLFQEGRKVVSSWGKSNYWKSKSEAREMKKFARSCMPIEIR